MSDNDHQSLSDFFEGYAKALQSMDPDQIARFWNVDDGSAIYIAEEIDGALIGWPAISGYWRDNAQFISRLAIRIGSIYSSALSPELTAATYRMHWDADMSGALAGGDVTVAAVVARQDDAWRLVHYTETALGALPFKRRAYRQAVSPDFALGANDKHQVY